jgi:protein-S-isoprenylcysteine O-methyltransferase Ste14
MVLYCVWFVLMGLDRRYGWSSVPVWLQAVGAFGIFLSVYLGYLTFRANSFASPVVKIQTERAHRVVTTGPDRYVRHPMYAVCCSISGTPLLLGSWLGFAFAPVFLGVLAFRITIEEKTPRAGLKGMTTMPRACHRLIPLIW